MRTLFAFLTVGIICACSASEEDTDPSGNPSGNGGTSSSGGAAGGTVGTAGTTGTGMLCTTTQVGDGSVPLIDDFEDGNGDITISDNRSGGWWFSVDGTGSVTPAGGAIVPVEGGNPGKALHVSGTGLTKWGADATAAVVAANGCYDASAYTGVKLSLKGTAASTVLVSVFTAGVRAAAMKDHFKKSVTLSADWTDVTIKWADLAQTGWGDVVAWDASKVYAVGVVAAGPAPAATPPLDFEFWIDNVSFTTD